MADRSIQLDLPRRRPADLPGVPSPLVDALTDLVSAETERDVAEIAVVGARTLAAARGAALGMLGADGTAVHVLSSVGYDCDAMRAGARLPLDSGLPIADSVRTRRRIVAGDPQGQGWVATPVVVDERTHGALLVSLDGSAPSLEALDALARATGAALRRVRAIAHVVRRSDALVAALLPTPLETPGWLDAGVRIFPVDGEVGGDVVLCVPDADDACWLVIADVCGSGAEAAVLGTALRPLVTHACTSLRSPAELLDRLDRVLSRNTDMGRFVTAAALRLEHSGSVLYGMLAVAGHPQPLLCHDGSVAELGIPATPLNLGLGAAALRPVDVPVVLTPEDTLLVHTDGLVDRLGPGEGDEALVSLFARAGRLGDAEATCELLLEALDVTAGPARDDLALLVVRPAG